MGCYHSIHPFSMCEGVVVSLSEAGTMRSESLESIRSKVTTPSTPPIQVDSFHFPILKGIPALQADELKCFYLVGIIANTEI